MTWLNRSDVSLSGSGVLCREIETDLLMLMPGTVNSTESTLALEYVPCGSQRGSKTIINHSASLILPIRCSIFDVLKESLSPREAFLSDQILCIYPMIVRIYGWVLTAV